MTEQNELFYDLIMKWVSIIKIYYKDNLKFLKVQLLVPLAKTKNIIF